MPEGRRSFPLNPSASGEAVKANCGEKEVHSKPLFSLRIQLYVSKGSLHLGEVQYAI
jgi:hypothetical protein